jgi:hypothetical protein
MRLALAGDTMLGRGVAAAIGAGDTPLFSPEVIAFVRDADAFVLNLECCISARGSKWPDPSKPFFFRAPPEAIAVLHDLGADAVTLANNHALDYGTEALADTLDLLDAAGIARTGAGRTIAEARSPALVDAAGTTLAVVGLTDHPRDFAATDDRPGVAYADLWSGEVPGWALEAVAAADADLVLVGPHWGPNMVTEPLPHVRAAATRFRAAGATLVAGHSAHVFHGVDGAVLFDLGDFVDDYAVDPVLRNDLGLVWRVTLDASGPSLVEALPIALDYCFTRVAAADEMHWIERRLRDACAPFGAGVTRTGDVLRVASAG